MSDKLTAERLRALDDLDNRAETLSDKVLAGQDVRQYLYDHRAAILAMAEERDRLEADVLLWKRIAAERSEQMQQLNLDRAAMGVETTAQIVAWLNSRAMAKIYDESGEPIDEQHAAAKYNALHFAALDLSRGDHLTGGGE